MNKRFVIQSPFTPKFNWRLGLMIMSTIIKNERHRLNQYLRCFSLSSPLKILSRGYLTKIYTFILWEKNRIAKSQKRNLRNNSYILYLNLALKKLDIFYTKLAQQVKDIKWVTVYSLFRKVYHVRNWAYFYSKLVQQVKDIN